MPYQNRVTPTGDLIAVNARGTLMGNRGCLHNAEGKIKKSSDRTAWIYCELEYKGRQQEVMAPGRYTQLFFLDEVTALSAGHRPCATCKRQAYNDYTAALKLQPQLGSIADIDKALKTQRSSSLKESLLNKLPDGAFVQFKDSNDNWLKWDGNLYRWSPNGYCEKRAQQQNLQVRVITPEASLDVLNAGYKPKVHLSVRALVQDSPSTYSTTAKMSDPVIDGNDLKVEHTVCDEPEAPTKKPTGGPKFKLKTTPRGSELYAYFAAILSETGMMDGEEVNLKLFMGNFKGHLDNGRIEKGAFGFKLTAQGREYFLSRHEVGSKQFVDPVRYQAMRKGLTEGGSGWVAL